MSNPTEADGNKHNSIDDQVNEPSGINFPRKKGVADVLNRLNIQMWKKKFFRLRLSSLRNSYMYVVVMVNSPF